MVSEIFFFVLFTIESMANLDPRGMVGRIYIGNHFAYKKAVGLMVFEKFSPIIRLTTLWHVTNSDPRGLVCWIFIRDHSTLLYTKYISCGPAGFREDF